MNRNQVLAYTFDFIHFLMDNLEDGIDEIILFGSVARGDFSKASDIDLFVNVNNKEKIKAVDKKVHKALREFETAASHSWKLRRIDLPIRPIVGNLDSKQWEAVKREIISTGLTVYGRYKELPKNLKPYYLFSFNLKSLKPKMKVKFIRQLYGYLTKKKKITYDHPGLLQKENALKLNPSTILVPAESQQKFSAFLNQFRISRQVREVWM